MTQVIVNSKEYELTGERIARVIELLGLDVVIKDIDIGDYLVEKDEKAIPIKRMSYKQFLQSYISKEIYSLIYSLIGTDGLIIVEIEDLNDIASNLYSYKLFSEASIKSSMKYKVPVFVTHMLLTSWIIYYIATEEIDSKPRKETKIYTSNSRELALSMLMKIPGIGPKTAARILATFKSLKNLANADIDSMMKVDRLGKEKAALIHEVFNASFDQD